MKSIQLLDCTLREAPFPKLNYGRKFLQNYIHALERVKVDVIEVGFLKNLEYIEGSAIFNHVSQIEEYLTDKKEEIRYVALVDYGRYDISRLPECNGKSIDGIRICFKKGEEKAVIGYAREIREKGYEIFIQHVDTLGYSDIEILDFINDINVLKPAAYSIVDTFGSMYTDDLRHIFDLVQHNLSPDIVLGFHAHNNLNLAVANAQEFVRLAFHKRNIVIDTSVLGCGRGAGNAHTELLIEFLNKKYETAYDTNEVLDLIDDYMPYFKENCSWGYSIPYFISGMHSAHVFNVNQLLKRHNIKFRDLRKIIESLTVRERKLYDYQLLEKLYVQYFNKQVDDEKAKMTFFEAVKGREVLLIAPGMSIFSEKEKVQNIIKRKPVIIDVNNVISAYPRNYVFFSSVKRYESYKAFITSERCILTSNIKTEPESNELIMNYISLIRYGWINLDNSAILLLRLLVESGAEKIYIAGFDGFSVDNDRNFYDKDLRRALSSEDLKLINEETREMLVDIKENINKSGIPVAFITSSIYSDIF